MANVFSSLTGEAKVELVKDELEKVLEQSTLFDRVDISRDGDTLTLEFEGWDSTGGDCIMSVEAAIGDTLDGTLENIESAITDYWEGFDPEEEFSVYWEAKRHGAPGIPGPRALIDAMEERALGMRELAWLINAHLN